MFVHGMGAGFNSQALFNTFHACTPEFMIWNHIRVVRASEKFAAEVPYVFAPSPTVTCTWQFKRHLLQFNRESWRHHQCWQ